ncbi:MAG: hypothetical protein KY462_16500 [Actinobacteria bacterium]|nr:hypothetical protein [Actinomycetota bacterium]
MPLVDVDAITLVLLMLELWDQDVHLVAACLQTRRTQELEAVGRRQLEAWGDVRREANRGLPAFHTPPDEPSVRYLGSVMLALRDDVGTTYEFRGRSMGGGQTEWRLTQQWRPGVPVQASILAVDVQDSDGVTVHSVELALRKDLITRAPG